MTLLCPFNRTMPKAALFLLALSLAAASALLRLLAFGQTPYANGWDSYFYLVQVKSVVETGQMHSPEASLLYPYLQAWYYLLGDYVLAMKVGTAVLCGLFTGLLCRFHPAMPVLGAWSLWSPQLTYFAAQYPKNLLGAVMLLAFVQALHGSGKQGKWWPVLPAVLLMANFFGHRFTFGLAVAYGLLWAFFRAGGWSGLPRKAFGAALVLILLLVLAGQVFPGLAHLTDWERLGRDLTGMPQFAPWSFVQSFGLERIGHWWALEIALVLCAWLWALFSPKNRSSNPALFWLCGLLLFPFLEWSLTGMAYRMFLMFVLIAPLSIDFQQIGNKTRLPLILVLVVLSVLFWKTYQPRLHDPDYALFDRITQHAQRHFSDNPIPEPELFIVHNALAEYFTFSTGRDAMPWLPEYPIDSNRLWRIAAALHEPSLRYYAGPKQEGKIKKLGGRYFLLPEHSWQKALQKAQMEGDSLFLQRALSWQNPSCKRPGFLLRRKGNWGM